MPYVLKDMGRDAAYQAVFNQLFGSPIPIGNKELLFNRPNEGGIAAQLSNVFNGLDVGAQVIPGYYGINFNGIF